MLIIRLPEGNPGGIPEGRKYFGVLRIISVYLGGSALRGAMGLVKLSALRENTGLGSSAPSSAKLLMEAIVVSVLFGRRAKNNGQCLKKCFYVKLFVKLTSSRMYRLIANGRGRRCIFIRIFRRRRMQC